MNLSDDDINELIGDGTCTHLPQVRMALEIRRGREMERRLEAWARRLEGDVASPVVGRLIAAELRDRMRGG